jgi:transposase
VSESNEVLTEPKLERRTRRRFSAAEKRCLLADPLPHGEGRKALAEQGAQGLEPKCGGRKPADPRDREIERRRRENARLAQRAQVADDLVALQKNSRTNRPAARPRYERAGRAPGAGAAQPRLCGAWPLAQRHLPTRASAPQRAPRGAVAATCAQRVATPADPRSGAQ